MIPPMQLHGSLQDNLEAAVASAKRLRDKPVYPDTVAYWSEVAAIARDEFARANRGQQTSVADLAAQLEEEIARRVITPR